MGSQSTLTSRIVHDAFSHSLLEIGLINSLVLESQITPLSQQTGILLAECDPGVSE